MIGLFCLEINERPIRWQTKRADYLDAVRPLAEMLSDGRLCEAAVIGRKPKMWS